MSPKVKRLSYARIRAGGSNKVSDGWIQKNPNTPQVLPEKLEQSVSVGADARRRGTFCTPSQVSTRSPQEGLQGPELQGFQSTWNRPELCTKVLVRVQSEQHGVVGATPRGGHGQQEGKGGRTESGRVKYQDRGGDLENLSSPTPQQVRKHQLHRKTNRRMRVEFHTNEKKE